MDPRNPEPQPPTLDDRAPSGSRAAFSSGSRSPRSPSPPPPVHLLSSAPPHGIPRASDGTLYDSPKSIRVLPHPAPPPLTLDHPHDPEDPEKGSLACSPSPLPPAVGGAKRGRKRADSTIVMTPWQPWRRRRGWSEWMGDTVSTPNMVPALVMQAFSTGILDATTYADFSVFASNQTGNAIILSIGFIDNLPILSRLTGASFGSFLLGALVFGQLGHHTGLRRRAWLLFSVFAQALVLAVSAILISPVGPDTTQIKAHNDWIVIALFAFMSGAQVAMARQSGSQELPTAPMTSSLVDLMADRNLLKWFTHANAGPRNRRLAYVVAMIGGAVVGACIHLYGGSWEVVVVTVFLKMVVFVQLALAGAQKD